MRSAHTQRIDSKRGDEVIGARLRVLVVVTQTRGNLMGKKKTPTNKLDWVLEPGETHEVGKARAQLSPITQAAMTSREWFGVDNAPDITVLAVQLTKQSKAIREGDLSQLEDMLASQAVTLDLIFNHMARWAQRSERVSHLSEYMRLALKAQSQARTTVDALATIKNPPIRQTNIAHGHQQVNNAPDAQAHSTADISKNEIPPTKQTGSDHELLPDSRASSEEISINPAMATVGEKHRSEE